MNTNTIKKHSIGQAASVTRPEFFAETVLRRVNEITESALSRVITDNKNILASADRLFRHPFGRDSAISAERLLGRDRELALQTLRLMIACQGGRSDSQTEEEPGKIFHELKFHSDGNAEQQELFNQLRVTLGIGNHEKLVSYTSIDATLEFIHLVARSTEVYGSDILRLRVDRRGETITVEQGVCDAARWLLGNIHASDIGLVGAHRTNPHGVIVPDLLDGATSFMHADGKTLINYANEVNTLNFQSLGYQTLNDAAGIVTDHHATEEERIKWRSEADELKQRTIEYFWMPEYRRVAMAVDRDEAGRPRRVETGSILPAVALRTGIFDNRPDIVEAIFKDLYTPDMMTCVGPRTQSLKIETGYTRYQEPPWPVLVGRVIEGAMRYKADDIAIDLTERMLMGIYMTGRAEEFHQVTRNNELGICMPTHGPGVVTIVATNKPEAPQAWTAATMWWLTHTALPQLAARSLSFGLEDRTGIDLTLNKNVKTIRYTLNQERAREIEHQILAKAAERYQSKIPA